MNKKILGLVMAFVLCGTIISSPVFAICGDGILEAGEECDDGPAGSATCSPGCTLVAGGGGGGGSSAIVIPGQDEPIIQVNVPDVGTDAVKKILPNVLAWVFGIFITITALMIIVAGLLFVTGGGKPEQTTKARQILIYALVGLAVALLAQGLMKLLETFVTSGNM